MKNKYQSLIVLFQVFLLASNGCFSNVTEKYELSDNITKDSDLIEFRILHQNEYRLLSQYKELLARQLEEKNCFCESETIINNKIFSLDEVQGLIDRIIDRVNYPLFLGDNLLPFSAPFNMQYPSDQMDVIFDNNRKDFRCLTQAAILSMRVSYQRGEYEKLISTGKKLLNLFQAINITGVISYASIDAGINEVISVVNDCSAEFPIELLSSKCDFLGEVKRVSHDSYNKYIESQKLVVTAYLYYCSLDQNIQKKEEYNRAISCLQILNDINKIDACDSNVADGDVIDTDAILDRYLTDKYDFILFVDSSIVIFQHIQKKRDNKIRDLVYCTCVR